MKEIKKANIKHIKIGDYVKVIAGGQKGAIGYILTFDKKSQTATLDSIKSKELDLSKENGRKIQISIHVSNLMLWDKETNIASRIGYKFIENKKKRYFKKSGNIVPETIFEKKKVSNS